MKEERMRRRVGLLLTAVMMTAVLSPQLGAVADLPDVMVMKTGSAASVEASLPLRAEVSGKAVTVARDGSSSVSLTAGEESGTAQVVFRLLGLVPVKTVNVTVERQRMLIPGGQSLGVALQTDGVVVVGASDLGNEDSPAQAAGIRPGDVIQSVDGVSVENTEALACSVSSGRTVRLGLLRGDEEMTLDVAPQVDPRDGAYKLGVWVRDSTAGVGTLTYYDPESGGFGALGHAITDVDTGVRFPVGEGVVYKNKVVSITRGQKGAPGELTGGFFENAVELGSIEKNTPFGVFGSADAEMVGDAHYPEGLPAAGRGEVHTGSAQILSTVDGFGVKTYDCEIEKVFSQSAPEARSMVIRITDPELLGKTGGIVQGMSGSPIIQDGKLVGAVTHVLVNDPTRGYGIFIENMLDAAS